MKNHPSASIGVVIPCYNGAAYLAEAVDSALAQRLVGPIVVIDDGSNDEGATQAIGERYASEHDRIIFVRQDNTGLAGARNAGLDLLDTEFVIFLDSDDRLAPDASERHLEEFQAHPDAVLMIGSKNIMDHRGFITAQPRDPVETVDRSKLALRVTPCPSQCMYRRAAIDAAGRFDRRQSTSEDIDLHFRMERLGKVYCHAHLAMDYREHPSQMTKKRVPIARGHLMALEKNLGPGAPEPDPALLRLARRHWLARYGRYQFRTALGQLRRGNVSDAIAPARLWLDAVPAWLHGALFGKPQIP